MVMQTAKYAIDTLTIGTKVLQVVENEKERKLLIQMNDFEKIYVKLCQR